MIKNTARRATCLPEALAEKNFKKVEKVPPISTTLIGSEFANQIKR
jgi:hypothetical protein